MATKKKQVVTKKKDITLVDALLQVVNCKINNEGCGVREIYDSLMGEDDGGQDDIYIKKIEEWANEKIKEGEPEKILDAITIIYEGCFC
jgi:hypothetical protein